MTPPPTLRGSLSAALGEGESLKIYNGTAFLLDAVVDNTALTWNATPTLTTDGSYTITNISDTVPMSSPPR